MKKIIENGEDELIYDSTKMEEIYKTKDGVKLLLTHYIYPSVPVKHHKECTVFNEKTNTICNGNSGKTYMDYVDIPDIRESRRLNNVWNRAHSSKTKTDSCKYKRTFCAYAESAVEGELVLKTKNDMELFSWYGNDDITLLGWISENVAWQDYDTVLRKLEFTFNKKEQYWELLDPRTKESLPIPEISLAEMRKTREA